MESHWDKLPEDVCIVIYKMIHKEQMTLLINEMQKNNREWHYRRGRSRRWCGANARSRGHVSQLEGQGVASKRNQPRL